MGATILRWFWRDGVRYRAYFRSMDGSSARELVIAAGSRSHAIPVSANVTLDELPESKLFELVANLDIRDQRLMRDARAGR